MSAPAGPAVPVPEPPGLANERTALAWQRTALSVVAAALVVARLSIERVGVLVLVVAVAGVVLGGWVAVEGLGRYRSRHGLAGSPGSGVRGRGGRATALLTVTVVLVALTELAAIARG